MSHDDFAFEPVPGLPERLPEEEVILWQGRPDAFALARDALNLPWVAGYFGLLAAWRFGAMLSEAPAGTALAGATPFVLMGAVVCALLWLVAFVQARATVYTITNRRVAMRIGAALTLTLNLPFRQVAGAGLALRRDGTGTIALELMGDTRLSFLVCWPHVRPWRLREPQPALRCIPDAANVARVLSEAAEARISTPQIDRRPEPAPFAAE
ncbi:photosynthetic complex putative assembly protein PuhB [Salipiger mucosus]|uniref:Putative photosynthetic complex assembly protein n=1 Tax=Salipiger mucosus DSM 16094 TaxID=1123237 RepID=S9Q8Q0_9RHOB|nr:photosynthetic complex putative assembly protein PuhB [Salipiger mucosus]EPX75993.1 Putative photosynthetic complex assembly protein [Salipiger mucosus DSM 16094]